MQDIFESIVPESKHTEVFQNIKNDPMFLPIKLMIQELFGTFSDVDGNFVEQFQTTGFDARLFELYVWAYLQESGVDVDRTHQYPDFLVQRGGRKAAIEVTTAVGDYKGSGKVVYWDDDPLLTRDTSSEAFRHHVENDVPLKFSSAILSKVKKKYWLNEHCQDLPFVIFLGGFFDHFSQQYSCGPLLSILFGLEFTQNVFGEMRGMPKDHHDKNGVKIPSGLFYKPTKEWADMDQVSAIAFSNAGVVSKFRRMGWYKGYYNSKQVIQRSGFCINHHGRLPLQFEYYLDCPPHKERWGDEVTFIHNPNATHPLPHDLFSNQVNVGIENGVLETTVPKNGFSVIASFTQTEFSASIEFDHPVVRRITKAEFDRHVQYKQPQDQWEMFWFENPVNQKIGVIYYRVKGRFSSCFLYRVFSTVEGAKAYKLYTESKKYDDKKDSLAGLLSEMTLA